MIIAGKQIAEELYTELAHKFAGSQVSLGILVGQDDPVIESFVRIKEKAAARIGVRLEREKLPLGATTDDAAKATAELAARTNGIIVQLPLPAPIDTDEVLSAIPKEKDVDGINPHVHEPDRLVHAPVAAAIEHILVREHVEVAGKKAVVVGLGRLVGKPAAALLVRLGAEVCTISQSEGSLEQLHDADIVVLGAGKPGLVKPEHLKSGVVLFDAGTSESNGKVVGDADQRCAEIASLYTPVPGGIGPIAVAMIFKNLLALTQAFTPSKVSV